MMNDMESQTGRKVAVLGPIPRDQIVTHAGERFEKYGCVLYTAVALSALLDAGDMVFPVSHVRRQDEGPIKEILGSFPNIDTSGITSSADQGDVIELRYIEHNRRVERQASFMNPIVPADVDEVLDADVFVCVPITDYEVGQPTLRHIKEHSGAALTSAGRPTRSMTRCGPPKARRPKPPPAGCRRCPRPRSGWPGCARSPTGTTGLSGHRRRSWPWSTARSAPRSWT